MLAAPNNRSRRVTLDCLFTRTHADLHRSLLINFSLIIKKQTRKQTFQLNSFCLQEMVRLLIIRHPVWHYYT